MRSFRQYYPADLTEEWWVSKWPEAIEREFAEFQGEALTSSFVFQEDSSDEQRFLQAAKEHRIDVLSEQYVEVSAREVERFNHYSLIASAGLDLDPSDFLDRSEACAGSPGFYCSEGAMQVKNIGLARNDMGTLELSTLGGISVKPPLIVVSRRVRNLLLRDGYTGIDLLPCIDSSEPSPAELSTADHLNERAQYFQLRVNARVLEPPHLEWVRKGMACGRCGAVKLFLGGGTAWFRHGALADTDFQFHDTYQTPEGTMLTSWAHVIASSRFLRLVIDEQVKGWEIAVHTPRVKYLRVPVR